MKKTNELEESYNEFRKKNFGFEQTDSILLKMLGNFKPKRFYLYTANPNIGDGIIFLLGAAAFCSKHLNTKTFFISDYSNIFEHSGNLKMMNRKDFKISEIQSDDFIIFDSKGFYQNASSINNNISDTQKHAYAQNLSFISELYKRKCRFLGVGSSISAAWSPDSLFSFVTDLNSSFENPYLISETQTEFIKFLPQFILLPEIFHKTEFQNVYLLSNLVWKSILGLEYNRSLITSDLLLKKKSTEKNNTIILNLNTRANYKKLRIEEFFEPFVNALVKVSLEKDFKIIFVEPDQFQSNNFIEKYEKTLALHQEIIFRFNFNSEEEKWRRIESSKFVISICSGFNHLAVMVNPSLIGISFRSWSHDNFNPWTPTDSTSLVLDDQQENYHSASLEALIKKCLENESKIF